MSVQMGKNYIESNHIQAGEIFSSKWLGTVDASHKKQVRLFVGEKEIAVQVISQRTFSKLVSDFFGGRFKSFKDFGSEELWRVKINENHLNALGLSKGDLSIHVNNSERVHLIRQTLESITEKDFKDPKALVSKIAQVVAAPLGIEKSLVLPSGLRRGEVRSEMVKAKENTPVVISRSLQRGETEFSETVEDVLTEPDVENKIENNEPAAPLDHKKWLWLAGASAITLVTAAVFMYYRSTQINFFTQGGPSANGQGDPSATGQGNSTVTGLDNSTVTGPDNSTVTGQGNSTLTGLDNSTVTGQGNSTVNGQGNSTVNGQGNSTVNGQGNSTVTGQDNSADQEPFRGPLPALELPPSAFDNRVVRFDDLANVPNYSEKFARINQYGNFFYNHIGKIAALILVFPVVVVAGGNVKEEYSKLKEGDSKYKIKKQQQKKAQTNQNKELENDIEKIKSNIRMYESRRGNKKFHHKTNLAQLKNATDKLNLLKGQLKKLKPNLSPKF